ncbi:MAG: phage baseplate assembly protein domain-containing protein [Janthinobacterium lividum]
MDDETHNRIAAQTCRGKVAGSAIATRTMLTITGLDNETFQSVELLLPYGMVARPAPGADILIQQINGQRDHKVALAGDHTEDAVSDLQPGEVGLSRNGQTVLLRSTGIEIVTNLAVTITATNSVTINAPAVYLGGTGGKKVALDGDPVVDNKVVSSATKVWGT